LGFDSRVAPASRAGRRVSSFVWTGWLSLLIAGAASADDRALGLSLARDGRCEAALETMLPLRTRPATDAELERLTGECALRLKRFELAVEALEAARVLEPEAPALDLHLAEAHYHQGQLDAAEAALERAAVGDARQMESAEWLLYAGLVALDRGDAAMAIDRLTAAAAHADDSVEPMASFFLARAQQKSEDRARARRSYEQVVEGYSGSAWAEQAARSIASLDAAEEIPVWASFEIGFEADDNALLRGRGVGRPGEISDDRDVRGYWFADVGALWLRRGAWSAGTSIRYAGSENDEFERFDTQAPGATLWLDRALGWQQSTLRLQYDADVAWIDATSHPFVVSHLWTTSLLKPWSGGGATTISAGIGLDDYLYERRDLAVDDVGVPGCLPCSPAGVDEVGATNRDGFGPIVNLIHRQPLPELPIPGFLMPWVEGGYRYQIYLSQGREYDHQRHQLELAAGIRLPLAIELSVRGRHAYVPYANRTVFPDPSDVSELPDTAYFLDHRARREQETGVRVQLQRAFGEHVLLSARWSRTRNRSTADVFDYTRDLFGLSLRIGWGG
jgi:tetratricopeptide (TPR) repeat protein